MTATVERKVEPIVGGADPCSLCEQPATQQMEVITSAYWRQVWKRHSVCRECIESLANFAYDEKWIP